MIHIKEGKRKEAVGVSEGLACLLYCVSFSYETPN